MSSEPASHEGIGLANTRARLEKHYGSLQSLRCTNRNQGGLLVEIRIPLRVQQITANGDGSYFGEAANVNH